MFGISNGLCEYDNFISNFCNLAKITYINISISEFNQKNNTILNFLNNILLRKICNTKKLCNKKIVNNENISDNYNEYLSPNSVYHMSEDNIEENDVYSIQPKLKWRRLSYNEKVNKH